MGITIVKFTYFVKIVDNIPVNSCAVYFWVELKERK